MMMRKYLSAKVGWLSLLVLLLTLVLVGCAGVTPDQGNAPADENSAQPEIETISWAEAEQIIRRGEVRHVAQTHDLEVSLLLADGRQVITTEPYIDKVFEVINECGDPCAEVMMATE
jgi:hypothetical protein